MFKLPAKLPSAYVTRAGVSATADLDTGGYDFMLAGHGFRFATDTQFAYQRYDEPTTVHRFDSSLEPGEQTLSDLPWIKSQSTFHAGAGQLNLEQGFTAFQYQQEQVEHMRFDNSIGVDVWTPGQVSRLPDVKLTGISSFTATCMVTAAVGGVDYAILGGNGNLYQAAWLAGPDAAPTVTAIDLTPAVFGGAANCNITSLATDGVHYFGVLQMTVVGSVPGVLTYFISGSITSTAAPTPIYDVSGVGTASPRVNVCTNPNFETSTALWAARSTGSPSVTLAQSSTQVHGGTFSCLNTASGASSFKEGALHTFATVNGTTYTATGWVYVNAGAPSVLLFQVGGSGVNGTSTSGTGTWQRLSVTFTASASTSQVCFGFSPASAGLSFYLDDVDIEIGATVGTFFDGSTATDGTYTYAWTGTANLSTSKATPIAVGGQALGIVGWTKARLIGCVAGKMYELDSNAAAHSVLPTPRYTHPTSNWLWTAIAESPGGILAAGFVGGSSSILEFTLDTSGGTPFLSGGQSVAVLPVGEVVNDLEAMLGSFLGIATNKGVRVGTFDTYTGALKYGPVSLSTTQPVLAVSSRDRFIYAGYTNQQADGKTGLARIDLSMVIDQAGRNAYAPDLRPPTTAPTGLGVVYAAGVLSNSSRIVFATAEGIHVEGNGPGVDGDAWLRTSRIRYDTAEPKLFTLGRVHGTLDVANIQVTGLTPFGGASNLGTFGFLTGGDSDVQFGLPTGLYEWMQLKFDLQGSASVLNSYQVKALPAPQRQNIIVVTGNCFMKESDRSGMEVVDPELPRVRYQNIRDLASAGGAQRFTEFTNGGSVSELVTVDQVQFQSFSRPGIEDDFGGYITFKLRAVS